jgi:hypothetical protein
MRFLSAVAGYRRTDIRTTQSDINYIHLTSQTKQPNITRTRSDTCKEWKKADLQKYQI